MASIPKRLYMLKITTGDAIGEFVRAVDDSRGDDYLCYTTHEDAVFGAQHQLELYDIECEPARVK
jgi:hypothetical protein